MTMRRLGLAGMCAVALAISGCSMQVPLDTTVTPSPLGLTDPATAISYTSWAFALPSRTRGDPAVAARAVAALVYLGGELSTNPQYEYGSPLINHEMLQARSEMRRVLGVAPTATSQQVVDALTTVYLALRQGDEAQTLQALSSPIFTLGPKPTLAILNDLPYVRTVNVATNGT